MLLNKQESQKVCFMKDLKTIVVTIFLVLFTFSASNTVAEVPDSNQFSKASSNIDNIISGRWNKGPVFASATFGNYLYFGSAGSIRVVKVTKDLNGKAIAWKDLSTFVTNGVVRDMHIHGEYLYVADGSGWMRIISLKKPEKPKLTGSIKFESEIKGLDVLENKVYMAAGWKGIHVVDVENKSSPKILKSIKPVGYALDLVVDGNYAYVASGHKGFKIVDISDLDTAKEIAHHDVSGSVAGIAYQDSYVYLVNMDDAEPRLSVFDVADRKAPKRVAAEPLIYGAERIRVDKRHAYVAGVANDAGLIVFDISKPSQPKKLGSWWDPTCSESVTIDGSIAYLSHGDQGLEVIDMQDPMQLKVIEHFDAAGHVRGIDTKGELAFVANGYRGLKIIDKSNKQNLQDVSEIKTYRALDVQVVDGFAHVADDWAGYKLIDISNPKLPKLVSELNTPGYAEDLFVDDKKVYIADGEGGLRIISFENPFKPVELGGLKLDGYVYEVVVQDNFAYVAAGKQGLVVINVANPSEPKLIASFNANDKKFEARGLTISKNNVFVAAGYLGVSIVDVSNLKALKQIGQYKTKRRANDISFANNRVYVIDSATVKTLDVSELSNPKLIKDQNILVNSAKIHLEKNNVYVAGMESGLIILDK